jgi:hypothetical protein
MGRFDAWATVVLLGPGLAPAPEPRWSQAADLVEAVAPLGDGCLVRIAATSTATLAAAVRRALAAVPQLLGDDPFTRRW